MGSDNAIFKTEVIYFSSTERIIGCYFKGSSESGDDSFLNEVNNNLLRGGFSGYGLYPLGEVITCCENPAKTIAGVILEFSNKIKPPLLKRGKDNNRSKGKSCQLLLPSEKLALLATLDMPVSICKNGGPIISSSQDLLGSCICCIMASTKS